MARELANIRLDIWTSQEFRDLTETEQRLYFLLLTHDSLSYAGVADWRPKRLAQFSGDSTPDSIEAVGRSLESKRFILIDDDSEEVLIRSFLKHDGLLKQPRLTVSMVNAYGATTSKDLRAVIIHELQKLVRAGNDWVGLKHERVKNLLKEPSAPIEDFINPVNMREFGPNVGQGFPQTSVNGTGNVSGNTQRARFGPNVGQGLGLHTATATATSPTAVGGMQGGTQQPHHKQAGTPIPLTWKPKDEHHRRAKKKHLDADEVADAFRAHAEAQDRRAANWDAAFTQWLIKEPAGNPTQRSSFNPWTASHDDYLHPEERAEIERRSRTQNQSTTTGGQPDDDAF